jgi:hypothetical protein
MGGVADYVRKSELDYLAVAMQHALREAREQQLRKQRMNDFLKTHLEETQMLPICSSCKKIRDKQNQWQAMEKFFLEYLNIHFTHGLCPDCAPKFFSME